MKDYNENISRNCNYNCYFSNRYRWNQNVSAQGNNNDFIGNDTTMTMNATLPTTIISNATLAFAQEGFQTEEYVKAHENE